MRRYEVAHLTPNGEIIDLARIAPAIPVFEEAFSAFARGTLIQTQSGPVAVEDLLPGDRIKLAEGGFLPLMWKGSMMVVPPSSRQTSSIGGLTRVSADTFGFSRPGNDFVFGPSARLFYRSSTIRSITGREGAFIPVVDFADGGSVVKIFPAASVEVFHLCLDRHACIIAGGLEVETYHPDSNARFTLTGNLLGLFMSLFPQLQNLEGFGLTAFPRLALQDLDMMDRA